MKKAISMLLALMMVLSLGTFTALAAERTMALTVETDKTEINAGEEITVTVNITEAQENFTSLEARIYYDDTLFQYKPNSAEVVNEYTIVLSEEPQTTADGRAYMKINSIAMNGKNKLAKGFFASATFVAKTDITETKNDVIFSTVVANVTPIGSSGDTFTLAPEATTPNTITVTPLSTYDYLVSLTPAAQNAVIGTTANVGVKIESTANKNYNSGDITLTYDTEKLTFDQTASTLPANSTVTDTNGALRIKFYGDDKALGAAFNLVFTVNAAGNADVKLTAAAIDMKQNAAQDIPAATLGYTTATITGGGYPVSLGSMNYFTGAETATPREDYTFEALDKNYDYTVTATMGGETVAVKDNGNGTFTIENVTGAIVISATRTAKSFAVSKSEGVTGADKATYGTDYTFTIPAEDEDYTYSIDKVTVGGTDAAYTVENGTYTIAGSLITGEVSITVKKTEKLHNVSVTVEGTGASDVTAEPVAAVGEDFTFTVAKKDGYTYEVTATMGGEAVTVTDNDDGTYTITGVTKGKAIVITVNKTETEPMEVHVDEYVKLADSKVMYLVTAEKGVLEDGQTYAYGDIAMMKYDGKYAYLVISDKSLNEMQEDAANHITKITSTLVEVEKTNDINGTGVVDINDAQLIWNMYNAVYSDFATATMQMFLRADVNGDGKIDLNDAVAVVGAIQ